MDKRIVITGLGILSPNGIGREVFFQALIRGVSGIKPISLFDTAAFKVKTAGEISDFEPQKFLGPKGLRTLDRSTKLINCAAALALEDAGLQITEENSCKTGVAVGTTFGSLKSIMDFDTSAIKDGIKYVNPALFPNTVINSPASQVSIRFNIKGFNVTISTGFCAGLDAINYGVNFIKAGRVNMVLAGGVEELCLQTFAGFYKAGCLEDGVVLGEGACLFVLEELDSALKRKAKIYAEIKGRASCFFAHKIDSYDGSGKGLVNSMQKALDGSGLKADDVDFISAAANSSKAVEMIEGLAIKKVFGEREVLSGSVKSMIGESFSASAAMQVASGVCAIDKQAVWPSVNSQQAAKTEVKNVLIDAFGPNGCNASMIMQRFS